MDERELTVLQKIWLDEGALVFLESDGGKGRATETPVRVSAPAGITEMAYADLYRRAKEAGLRYAVLPKKARLIEDLAAAQAAAGVLTRPEGVNNG